jgi:hypothetical protein
MALGDADPRKCCYDAGVSRAVLIIQWIRTGEITTMTSPFDKDAANFLKAGKGQAEALTALQKEMMEAYEEAGRVWSERMRTELELWTELGKKLTSTHSLPEAMQIYQQSLTRRMQMAAEDSQKFTADCQKFAQKIARTMTPGGGWGGGSS